MENLFDPDVPLHHQIYQQLRGEIMDGVWVGRSDFPGEEELASRYGVSVITSRRAMQRLVEAGLLKRERGRRPHVTFTPPPALASPAPPIFPTGPHRPYRYRVVEIAVRVASADACRTFGLGTGMKLWHCSRLRLFEARPHSMVFNVQQVDVGARHARADLETHPMNVIFQNEGYRLGSIERRIFVRPATPLIAEHLAVSVSTSLLFYTYVLNDADGAPLEWVQIALHPDQSAPVEVLDLLTGTVRVSDIL